MSDLEQNVRALAGRVSAIPNTPWQAAATVDNVVAACQGCDDVTKASRVLTWALGPTASGVAVARSQLALQAVSGGRIVFESEDVRLDMLMQLALVASVQGVDHERELSRSKFPIDAGPRAVGPGNPFWPLYCELSSALTLLMAQASPARQALPSSGSATTVRLFVLAFVCPSDVQNRP